MKILLDLDNTVLQGIHKPADLAVQELQSLLVLGLQLKVVDLVRGLNHRSLGIDNIELTFVLL